jgi:Fe-S cluster biogenesis protein NfuA
VLAQTTPNPAARQFSPGDGGAVLRSPGPALDYRTKYEASESPLATQLFGLVPGVSGVTLAQHFVTVSLDLSVTDWEDEVTVSSGACSVALAIEGHIDSALSSSEPLVDAAVEARRAELSARVGHDDDDDETVRDIKEVLETHVRPNVQADGGDVEYVSFDHDSGHLVLRLVGACVSCASSTVTVRFMIKNVVCHYVDAVKQVSAADPEAGDERDETWTG